MKKINQNQVGWDEIKSPKCKFHLFRRHLSLALGGKKDIGGWGGGHPFDLELTRLPAGATNWPYHTHSAQWELYVVLSGRGLARTPEGEVEIGPGDCFVHPPGEPHQIRNPGPDELLYYVIADNPPVEIGDYPNSGKMFFKRYVDGKFERKIFMMNAADYYEDEE